MAVGYAGAVLGDFHLAEDAAQEAFVEAFAGLDKVYAVAAFPAWLRRVVFKHCDRILRRRREETGLGDGGEVVSVGGLDPLQAVEAGDNRTLVHGALAALPEAERTVALLFYINDHSQREIGAFLDIPVSTVKNRLRVARKRLKEEVTEMVKQDLQNKRPSQSETFSTQVQDYLTVLTVMHEKLLPMLKETFTKASVAFEATTGRILEALGTRVSWQRLDSTHVISNIAVLSRLGLLCETMRHFLSILKERAPPVVWARP